MGFLVRASKTLTLWHGGNLDYAEDYIAHKGGRWEHGPGLYLITTYSIAKKYAKGSRKLYRVVISEGHDIKDATIPAEDVKEFLRLYCIKKKLKEVAERLEKYTKDGKVQAENFVTILMNNEAIKNTDTDELRRFLVTHGIDYWIADNMFGFTNRMVVLFNNKKIVSKERMSGKEIEVFDLPTRFS